MKCLLLYTNQYQSLILENTHIRCRHHNVWKFQTLLGESGYKPLAHLWRNTGRSGLSGMPPSNGQYWFWRLLILKSSALGDLRLIRNSILLSHEPTGCGRKKLCQLLSRQITLIKQNESSIKKFYDKLSNPNPKCQCYNWKDRFNRRCLLHRSITKMKQLSS